MEIWKDIEGYEGLYKISNSGKIKSVARIKTIPNSRSIISKEIILKPYKHKYGYLLITLSKDNCRKKYSIHRLVLGNI